MPLLPFNKDQTALTLDELIKKLQRIQSEVGGDVRWHGFDDGSLIITDSDDNEELYYIDPVTVGDRPDESQ